MSVICCDDPRPHRHATSADIRIGDVLLPWYPGDPAGESVIAELYTEVRQYSSVLVRVDHLGRRTETYTHKPTPLKVATDRGDHD